MIDLLIIFIALTLFVLAIDTNLRVGKLRSEVELLRRYITFMDGVSRAKDDEEDEPTDA